MKTKQQYSSSCTSPSWILPVLLNYSVTTLRSLLPYKYFPLIRVSSSYSRNTDPSQPLIKPPQGRCRQLDSCWFYCAYTVPTDLTPAILLPAHSKVKPVLLQGQGISQGAQAPESSPEVPIYSIYVKHSHSAWPPASSQSTQTLNVFINQLQDSL